MGRKYLIDGRDLLADGIVHSQVYQRNLILHCYLILETEQQQAAGTAKKTKTGNLFQNVNF